MKKDDKKQEEPKDKCHCRTELEDLKKQLEECMASRDSYLNSWQRERADFINYRKEESQRLSFLGGYAKQAILESLLPILDNFEIASKHLTPEDRKNPNVQGLLMIKKQFQDLLKTNGIEEIQCLNQPNNPIECEVLEEREAPEQKPGIVIEVIQKGFKTKDKVLRPAKVIITK